MIGYGVRKLAGLHPSRPNPVPPAVGAVKWGATVEVYDQDRVQVGPWQVPRVALTELVLRERAAQLVEHEPYGTLVSPALHAYLREHGL